MLNSFVEKKRLSPLFIKDWKKIANAVVEFLSFPLFLLLSTPVMQIKLYESFA